MHDNIKGFHRRGVIPDINLIKEKERHCLDLEKSMREHSYVPVLDLEPQFTLNYRPEEEEYDFRLTIYGVKVAREEVDQWAGMSRGKLMKSTVKSK